jgi:hypothetical protein
MLQQKRKLYVALNKGRRNAISHHATGRAKVGLKNNYWVGREPRLLRSKLRMESCWLGQGGSCSFQRRTPCLWVTSTHYLGKLNQVFAMKLFLTFSRTEYCCTFCVLCPLSMSGGSTPRSRASCVHVLISFESNFRMSSNLIPVSTNHGLKAVVRVLVRNPGNIIHELSGSSILPKVLTRHVYHIPSV